MSLGIVGEKALFFLWKAFLQFIFQSSSKYTSNVVDMDIQSIVQILYPPSDTLALSHQVKTYLECRH